jgi:hypothetical protein
VLLQASKGYTINSLKAKLIKHGVTVTSNRPAAVNASGTPAYFDLNNLFAVDEMEGSCFKVPRYFSVAADSIDAAMGEGNQQVLRSIQVCEVLTVGGGRGGLPMVVPSANLSQSASNATNNLYV